VEQESRVPRPGAAVCGVSPVTTRTWCARCAWAHSRCGPDLGGRRRDRQVGVRAQHPDGVPRLRRVYYVLEKMRPQLEATMEGKTSCANWRDGGWVHFFTQETRRDARRSEEAQAVPVGGRHEDMRSGEHRLQPVPLPSTELATASRLASSRPSARRRRWPSSRVLREART